MPAACSSHLRVLACARTCEGTAGVAVAEFILLNQLAADDTAAFKAAIKAASDAAAALDQVQHLLLARKPGQNGCWELALLYCAAPPLRATHTPH